MTSYSIREVNTREDFDACIDIQWEAMLEPFRPEFPLLHPILGHTEADRLASLQADKDRRWDQHRNNSASHWLAVADDNDHGRIVGAAQWQIHLENPFPNGPCSLECTWFPEGETRDFVTEVINQCYHSRMNWMDRPHMSLNEMAVLPNSRRQGIGSLIMKWGLQRAEELNLECFLEASNLGIDLYEHFGFRRIMTFAVNTHRKNASQTWKKLHNQCPLITCTCMWRPAPKDVENETTTPSFWSIVKRSQHS